jgi:hypothetical protein
LREEDIMAARGNDTTTARAALHGIPTISDTFNPDNPGTDWPMDAYTVQVSDHQSPEPLSRPAVNSYAGDGNMEALSAFPPFTSGEDRSDLGTYTGAVGPV